MSEAGQETLRAIKAKAAGKRAELKAAREAMDRERAKVIRQELKDIRAERLQTKEQLGIQPKRKKTAGAAQ